MRANSVGVLALTLMSLHVSASPIALETSPTLTRIAQQQAITLGHRLQEIPFSYVVDGQPVGYSIDLCRAVVAGLQQRLGGVPLEVRFVPVTPVNRFILLRHGEIDLECGVTTRTSERLEQAAFSYPHFLHRDALCRLGRKRDAHRSRSRGTQRGIDDRDDQYRAAQRT